MAMNLDKIRQWDPHSIAEVSRMTKSRTEDTRSAAGAAPRTDVFGPWFVTGAETAASWWTSDHPGNGTIWAPPH